MGLANSLMKEIASEEGIDFISEAFADRAYESDGLLRSRSKEGSVHSDPEIAAQQVISIATRGQVMCNDKSTISLHADSICIHGDNPAAVGILKGISVQLKANNISLAQWK